MISIVMGSISDAEIMRGAANILVKFEIPYEMYVVSAHRTPDWMYRYARELESRGIRIVIAGAGGAAHLPGMLASLCSLPVIGVPILSSNSFLGLDSMLSILQMPKGVPVATVSLNNAENAGLLALRMLGTHSEEIRRKLSEYQKEMGEKILEQAKEIPFFVFPKS